MKAMVMARAGNPDILELKEIPAPAITGPTEVLVRVKAAGVNPVDTKLRRGHYHLPQLPALLGCDGAGVVEATGKHVTRVKPGDEIYFFHGGFGLKPGNYAEYTVLDERFLALKPRSLDFIRAAAAPLVLITAWEALHDRARLGFGHTVLIHAGAGGVGHIAIQLAKLAGARVATTIGSEEKITFVNTLGADCAINYRQQDFVAAVLEWTQGKGVDIAMDNVGGGTFQATFPAVRFYGDLVTLLPPENTTDWTVARQRNLRVSLEVMLSPQMFDLEQAQRHQAWILEEGARRFDGGELTVHVSHVLPLGEAAEAHALLEKGGTIGKIVLAM